MPPGRAQAEGEKMRLHDRVIAAAHRRPAPSDANESGSGHTGLHTIDDGQAKWHMQEAFVIILAKKPLRSRAPLEASDGKYRFTINAAR
jgi:hypothetical protein